MARPQRLCPSRSRKIMAQACTPICRSGKAKHLSLLATVMPGSPTCACISSAASSSMPRRSTLFQTRQRTATSVWFQAMKRLFCLPIQHVTVRPHAVFPMVQVPRPSASKCASPTQWQTRIYAMPPCSWPALTASRTRSTLARRWTRICMTCHLQSLRWFQLSLVRFVKRWIVWPQITTSC